jgi:peptide-methionine (R)-S-oxide reductase
MDKEKLKEKLTPEQYSVCVLGETEAPFSGNLLGKKEPGTYNCVVCDQELFSSDHKYESGTGWPSFFQPLEGATKESEDTSHGMSRTEISCSNCGSHLGHVFEDGPSDKTGKRFCINSVALKFNKNTDE